jgi:hypothetical protein
VDRRGQAAQLEISELLIAFQRVSAARIGDKAIRF